MTKKHPIIYLFHQNWLIFPSILLQKHMIKRWICLWMKIFYKKSAQWANNRSWFVGSIPQWCSSSSSVKLFSTIWSPRSNASNGGRISNHHRPWNILFWFVCPLQLLWISLIYTCGVYGCLVAKCGKLSLKGILLYLVHGNLSMILHIWKRHPWQVLPAFQK